MWQSWVLKGYLIHFAPRAHWEVFAQMPYIFLCSTTYPKDFLTIIQNNVLIVLILLFASLLEGDLSPLDWREHELQRIVTLSRGKGY